MKERNYAIDFIRLIAILGVVTIHVSTAFIDRAPQFTLDFNILHGINQAARFAVPLFFLISGLLLGTKYGQLNSAFTFYKKRVSKIFTPYVIWSALYFLIAFSNPISLKFVDSLIKGTASYQLYFIPSIIILYASFPFFIFLKKVFLTRWFIILLFLIESIVLYFLYFEHRHLPLYPPIRTACYNLFPFLFGVFLGVHKVDLSKLVSRKIWVFVAASVILWGGMMAESLLFFQKTGNDSFLRDQWRISVLTYGILIGSVFYFLYEKYLTAWKNGIEYLSRFSFGVFFLHVVVLKYSLFYVVNRFDLRGMVAFTITLTLTLIASFAVSIALSRIKLVGTVLGLKG